MNTEELQVVAFEIILHSGTARATVHEAFAAMRLGHYDEASQKLEAANTEIGLKHITHRRNCCKITQVALRLRLRSSWFMHRII